MTKERKLAIEMWKDIRDMLSAFDRMTMTSILEYKETFCKDHGLHWMNNCWFCQYIFACSKCPLKSCSTASDYYILKQDDVEKDVRVAVCNNIIKALGGKA